MTDRPIIFSGPMVRALLEGRKTQTRRLATSPLRRCEVGDRLYVRETLERANGEAVGYPANGDWLPNTPWQWQRKSVPSIHMPRWVSRLTLTVIEVRVQRLREITLEDVLAEGAPLDPNHRDGTQDGSNPVMCIGDRPFTTQSPRAWYHRLWDSLHTEPGETWADNPEIVALSFTVARGNIDAVTA